MRVNATGPDSWTSPDHDTRLVFAAGSHPGRVREVNEDSSLVAPPVFLVADGMGGYARGDVASRIVAESFEPLAGLGAVQPGDVERTYADLTRASSECSTGPPPTAAASTTRRASASRPCTRDSISSLFVSQIFRVARGVRA